MQNNKEKIGFIGAGLMGHGMALHIHKGGYPLTVIANKNRAPIDDLVKNGASEAATIADLTKASDIIIMCVSNSPQVEQIILGENGILQNAREGQIIIDSGTSLPASTQMLNKTLRDKGILFCDSPLSRTPAMAAQGKLLSMTAAEKPLLEKIRPILECYSEVVVHVSETIGKGHEFKLLNNFLATGYAAIWAEAYSVCIASGNDPKVFHEIVSGGGLNCTNFQNFSKYPLNGDPNGQQFALANCAKDMDYYIRHADALPHSTIIADPVRQLYKLANAAGKGKQYLPTLTTYIQSLNPKP